MKIVITIILAVWLVGCASTQINENTVFTKESTEGLAILGVSGEDSYEVWFAAFDPQTGRLNANSFSGHEGVAHDGRSGTAYKVLKMPPGNYILKNLSSNTVYFNNIQNKTYCLSDNTYYFNVKAGEITYLGDIYYDGKNRVIASDGKLERAQSFIRGYPGIEGDVELEKLIPSKFVNGTDIFGKKEVCGGYYFD